MRGVCRWGRCYRFGLSRFNGSYVAVARVARVALALVVRVALGGCGGAAPPAATAVGVRTCGDGTRVRDPHDRFSFCTPYNAWVSTMHAGDDPAGPFDYTFYALRPGTSFSVTVRDRGAPPAKFPHDARVATDRASFHGRDVEHQHVRFHLHTDRQDELLENGRHAWHEAEDHDVTIERWTTPDAAGSITITSRVQEDTSAELRAALAEVVGSFRFGTTTP
ncbi:MAG: hypothetical protein ABI467_02275 [Kofleriaceae bacterium]